MTLTRSHTTDPFDGGEGGSYLTWWVADGPRMVALSVQHWPNGAPAWTPPSLPSVTTPDGDYILDCAYLHEPGRADCRWHEACEATALSQAGVQAWQQHLAAGWSDDAVYAQLEQLHGEIFAEVLG